MFGWEMLPDYDCYIWVDASCTLLHPESVAWFLEQLGNADIAVFKHPDRISIQDEYEFLQRKLEEGNKYLVMRYENELLHEQYIAIKRDPSYMDDKLYASTAFIYKNTETIRLMLREWWVHTSRYHSIDQLAFPYVLWKSGCFVNVINEDYRKCLHIIYTRNKQ